jgi:hypothetical protein
MIRSPPGSKYQCEAMIALRIISWYDRLSSINLTLAEGSDQLHEVCESLALLSSCEPKKKL